MPPEPDYAAHDEGNVARCPQAAREDPPRGLVLMTPSRRRPDPEPTLTIFPDQLHLGDRFAEADVGDEERVWEVVSRPVTYKQGHEVRARVQRPGEPRTAREHAWPAHQKISVRRNATAASRPLTRPASDAGAAYDIEALRQGAPAAARRECSPRRRTRPSWRSASSPCSVSSSRRARRSLAESQRRDRLGFGQRPTSDATVRARSNGSTGFVRNALNPRSVIRSPA